MPSREDAPSSLQVDRRSGRPAAGSLEETAVPDVKRFAGYGSPDTLTGDSSLSRDEKISGLRTWRAQVRRGRDLKALDAASARELLAQIERALAELRHH
jgi:hypothetical protein